MEQVIPRDTRAVDVQDGVRGLPQVRLPPWTTRLSSHCSTRTSGYRPVHRGQSPARSHRGAGDEGMGRREDPSRRGRPPIAAAPRRAPAVHHGDTPRGRGLAAYRHRRRALFGERLGGWTCWGPSPRVVPAAGAVCGHRHRASRPQRIAQGTCPCGRLTRGTAAITTQQSSARNCPMTCGSSGRDVTGRPEVLRRPRKNEPVLRVAHRSHTWCASAWRQSHKAPLGHGARERPVRQACAPSIPGHPRPSNRWRPTTPRNAGHGRALATATPSGAQVHTPNPCRRSPPSPLDWAAGRRSSPPGRQGP